MRTKLFLTLITVLFFAATWSYGAIPISERNALIDLYNATNGDSWTNNSNWKDSFGAFTPNGTENLWFGVMVVNDHVYQINLQDNNLTGVLPPSIGSDFPELVFLFLQKNHIGGTIPDTWGGSPNLMALYLSTNEFVGPLPCSISFLINLWYLDFSNNQLSGEIPDCFCRLINIRILVGEHNEFTGCILECFFRLPNLVILDFSYNHLSCFPEIIIINIGCKDLEQLYLDNNEFIGPIPTKFSELAKLKVLYLHNNKFTERIPEELGDLTELEYLTLNWNKLSGNIPDSLGELSNLRQLHLQSNAFTGLVPASFFDISDLNLDYNALRGEKIPSGRVMSFLDTQTIAPAGVVAFVIDTDMWRVSWTPITYLSGNGGYDVYYDGTFIVSTASKSDSFIEFSFPGSADSSLFTVKTRTEPYWNNPNQVISSED